MVKRPERLWLALSLTVSITCALFALREAYSAEFIAPLDARLHVFWAERLQEPALFKGDLLADYFESVAPIGVRALFAVALSMGISALTYINWLPLLLGPATTYFAFRLTRALGGGPAIACFGSVLLTLSIWMRSDLACGAARCYLYPFFTAFLYFLCQRRWTGLAATVISLSILYPPIALVAMGTLAIDLIRSRPHGIRDLRRGGGILFAALLLLVVQAARASAFGPALTPELAVTLPELAPGGRFAFYVDGWAYWTSAYRSGLFPLFEPVLSTLGWWLPGLVFVRSPIAKRIIGQLGIFVSLAASSLALFILSHQLLFRLYEPSRYTMHSARIMLAIGAALVVAVVFDLLARSTSGAWRLGAKLLAAALPVVLAGQIVWLGLLHYPFPYTSQSPARSPELIRFVATQPNDTIIATLLEDANDIPIFAKRRVLVAPRFGLPWHVGYYQAVRERVTALIEAQYSTTLDVVQHFVRTYGVDLWVIDRWTFDADRLQDPRWFREQEGPGKRALEILRGAHEPILKQLRDACRVFSSGVIEVISGSCLLDAREESGPASAAPVPDHEQRRADQDEAERKTGPKTLHAPAAREAQEIRER